MTIVQPNRLERWESRGEWPLTALAVAFLVAYAWEILGRLTGSARFYAELVVQATWVIFAVDYFVRLLLAQQRWRWFSRHLLDLASVALPVLRPLRLLRLVALMSVLQRTARSNLRGRVALYAVGSTSVLVSPVM